MCMVWIVGSNYFFKYLFFIFWKSLNSQGQKVTPGEGYTYDYHQGP